MESSRIFVRGLPPNLTSDEFRKHFSKQAVITDAKCIPHRRIGYVGFKSPEDAAKAVKYYNKTFIRTTRIEVEVARPVMSEVNEQRTLKPLPDNGGSEAPSVVADHGLEKSSLGKRKRVDLKGENAKLQEYLEVMQPPSKSRIWANEDLARSKTKNDHPLSPAPQRVEEIQKDEEYEFVPKKPQKSRMFKEDSEPFEEVEISPQTLDISASITPSPAEKIETPEVAGPRSSDEDWLRSRTNRLLGLVEDKDILVSANEFTRDKVEISEGSINATRLLNGRLLDPSSQTDERTEVTRESIPNTPLDISNELSAASRRLFVRNLSYTTTEEDLRRHFEGDEPNSIVEVHLAVDSRTGNGKGFAYVQYPDIESANNALQILDGKPFQGRLLHIIPALARKQSVLDEFAIAKLPLKKQQHIKRKAEAASATFKWNSLYMNADAVMSSISDRLGISKSELLDPMSSNAAVKQAHAETHIIQETKAYFTTNGVNLDAFKNGERGDTAILVKNFAYGTKSEELKKLFEVHGNVLRVLMPPAGTISIVQFENAEHARSAFRSLAYRKFKDSVLLLEKAPKLLLNSTESRTATGEVQLEISQRAKVLSSDLLEVDDSHGTVDTSTLFVRNLSFLSTTERLREAFESLDGFMSAKVKMKPDPKKSGQFLSMGFGFLEFRSKQQAQAALAAMDGYKLDGHNLLIRASHKGVCAAEDRRKIDEAKKIAGRRTKIIIKNLPFEASKKDIRALFGSYGKLRSVRMPKKFDSSTRGFAFAEFVTAREAENAIGALKDTHLLGRRLVLEFAAEDALDPEKEIEQMQNKVGNQANKVALQKLASSGRKKFNLDGGDDSERD